MNLKQLQYFVKLAETEHYRRAAESLYITEPSLNRAIRDMEGELGLRLFEKKGRNIYLTKYGRMFLPYVKRSLQELDKGTNIMQAYTRPDHGRIILGFIYTMGYTFVPELITQFQAIPQHKGITFDFKQGTTSQIAKDLKDEKMDVAFCSYVEDEPDIIFYPISEEELVVAVPKGHPLGDRESVSLKELEPYPFISFSKNSGLYEMVTHIMNEADSHPDVVCHIEEDNAMAGLVSSGYGVAIIPDFYTLKYYNLDRIPIANPLDKRYLFMAVYRHANMLPIMETFRNFVLSRWQTGNI